MYSTPIIHMHIKENDPIIQIGMMDYVILVCYNHTVSQLVVESKLIIQN